MRENPDNRDPRNGAVGNSAYPMGDCTAQLETAPTKTGERVETAQLETVPTQRGTGRRS